MCISGEMGRRDQAYFRENIMFVSIAADKIALALSRRVQTVWGGGGGDTRCMIKNSHATWRA